MDDRLIELLERVVVGSVAVTERAIAAAGTDLTFVQWRVLLIVGEQPDGATVSEVASRIGARGSPASRLISRLKRRGVVIAERDPSDGRVARIQLTESGRSLRGRVLEQRRRSLDALATAISFTELERETLRQVATALASFT
jgi:DNA-binding MarR family transcriptional regulator